MTRRLCSCYVDDDMRIMANESQVSGQLLGQFKSMQASNKLRCRNIGSSGLCYDCCNACLNWTYRIIFG